jgi:L-threonate 2-dehydrogenase
MTAQRVAVIGLGSMGSGMAQSLLRAGFAVTGCDVDPATVARFVAADGEGAATPAEAAKDAMVVVSVVVTAAQTETILFGAHGVAESLAKDAVFVSSATMAPEAARALAGSSQAFVKARGALEAMAATIYELGEAPGQGAAFKMINQLLAGVHIAVASEAMAFAARQGLDLKRVYEVITRSAGNSWCFENRMSHVLENDYTPRSAIEIFVKDLGIVEDMARAARFPVPMASTALQLYLMTAAAGMGRDDDSSVARLYAQIAGIDLTGSL